MSLREELPRSAGTPCPDEERQRQAGLLAHGSAPFRPPSQGCNSPNGMWSVAHRLQLQGQPGHYTQFPLNPLAGNLSLSAGYSALQHFATPLNACAVTKAVITTSSQRVPARA